MTALLNLGGGKVSNAADAADPQDYVTKKQLDAVVVGSGNFITTNTTKVIGVDFSTINEAITWANNYFITSNSKLTISVPAGKHTASTLILDHASGRRIEIVGVAPVTLTSPTLVSIVSNGSRDHDVTWEFASVSGVTINNILKINGLTGTGNYKALEGCFPIVSITGNKVTVKVRDKRTAIGAATVTSGTFKAIQSVIYVAGMTGIAVYGSFGANSIGIRDIALLGSGSANTGVFLDYGAVFNALGDFGVTEFGKHGIYAAYTGTVNAQNSCVSNCGMNGYYALNGSVIQAVGGVASGCGGAGFAASNGSRFAVSNSSSSGNNMGYYSVYSSAIISKNAYFTGNAEGLRAEDSSIIIAASCNGANNTSYGAHSMEGSYIAVEGGSITSSGLNDVYAEAGSINTTGATIGTYETPVNIVRADRLPRAFNSNSAIFATPKGATLTINSGAITINSSAHIVNTEGSTAIDMLDTINGGYDGAILKLGTSSSARDIVVTTAGNIRLAGGKPILLSTSNDFLYLEYDGVTNLWKERSFLDAANLRVRGLPVNTTPSGNIGVTETNLQTVTIPAYQLSTGKGIKVTAWGIFANNANAKTAKLYFGSGLAISIPLPANQTGKWRIQAEIYSTGVNAQTYSAQATASNGALSIDGGNFAEVETSNILVKTSGLGASNNDIVSQGLELMLIG